MQATNFNNMCVFVFKDKDKVINITEIGGLFIITRGRIPTWVDHTSIIQFVKAELKLMQIHIQNYIMYVLIPGACKKNSKNFVFIILAFPKLLFNS